MTSEERLADTLRRAWYRSRNWNMMPWDSIPASSKQAWIEVARESQRNAA